MNWKWLFIYPDYGVATVNQLPIPTGTPIDFSITSDGIMNSFFIPQLGSQIYAMAGMQTQLHLIANKPGNLRRPVVGIQRAGISRTCTSTPSRCPPSSSSHGRAARAGRRRRSTEPVSPSSKPSIKVPPATYGRVAPGLFEGVVDEFMSGRKSQMALSCFHPAKHNAWPRLTECRLMFGKLSLDAIPFNEPIIMGTGAVVAILGLGVLGLITYFGKWKYLWTEWLTSVDHKTNRRDVLRPGLVMLLRGFADAIMMRTQQAIAVKRRRRLPAAASLRPDLHRPRR